MLAQYLRDIGTAWKSHVKGALFVVSLLVTLELLAKPPTWVYWAIVSATALLSPYWAYKRQAEQVATLEGSAPLADEQRLRAAKKLIRDAAERFEEMHTELLTAERYEQWLCCARNLMGAILLDDSPQLEEFDFYPDSQLQERRRTDVNFFLNFAGTLGRYAEHLKIPPERANPGQDTYLDPNFVPQSGLRWQDY